MSPAGSAGRGQTRRLALMAIVAVLLGTVVAANVAEDPGATDDPRASFTFETDNETVLVTHFGGDELDPATLYVESGVRGRLGNFDGSAGMACTRNVTQLRQGTTCRVPDAAYEQLFVVWENEDNRTLILARRAPDPTPTPTPTPVPTATVTPTTPNATVTPGTATPPATVTGTATTGTPTVTATPGGTATPNGTDAPGTGTPNGTATLGTGTPNGTDAPGTGTPTGSGTQTPTGTGTAES